MPYTKTTDFAIKDTYLSGNPAKVVKGAEIDTEFENIEMNFNGIGPLGTAAAANVTTSATDTTAGRVLKVGDFGLGAIDLLDNPADLNTIFATGFYLVTGANQPAGLSAGFLIVTTNGTVTSVQRYIGQGGTREFIRAGGNTTWTPWVEVWTTGNLVKTTSATDTTVGSITKVGDFGLGSNAATIVTDCNTFQPNGIYRTSNTTLNTPFAGGYYNLLCMSLAASKSQLAQDAFNNKMHIRNYNGTAWSPWVEVATSANSLGQGQTWQDVTGSRALGTTYTNTTGRPIMINVLCGPTQLTNTSIEGYVESIKTVGQIAGAVGQYISGTFTVQIGATYRLQNAAGTAPLAEWKELR
jgi:hypothetical protein